MDTENKNIIYNAGDIKQYLDGKMPAPAMYALEKAALDDPFLAEAIEGYEALESPDWQRSLNELKEDFAKKDKQAKLVLFNQVRTRSWWKVAAAIFIIGSGITVTYLFTKNETKGSDPTIIAQHNEIRPDPSIPPVIQNTPSLPADSATDYIAASKGKTVIALKPVGSVATDQLKLNPSPEADESFSLLNRKEVKSANSTFKDSNGYIRTDDFIKQPSSNNAPVQQTDAKSTASASNNNAFDKQVNPVNPGFANETKAFEQVKLKKDNDIRDKKELQLNRNFIAQVVGQDNSPLPFANISIKSEDFGTYADVNGNFRLISVDSVLTVEVKSVGYQPQYYTLKSNVQQNKIILEERQNAAGMSGDPLAKKIVPQNSIRRSRLIMDTIQNIEPADGWENYNTYVTNNIELPDDVTKKNMHGDVELSFDVSSSGAITNIKIDKSLCGNCDEAARKLLEQGPKWKLKAGKNGKAKLKVQF
jgi:hypothetical protein